MSKKPEEEQLLAGQDSRSGSQQSVSGNFYTLFNAVKNQLDDVDRADILKKCYLDIQAEEEGIKSQGNIFRKPSIKKRKSDVVVDAKIGMSNSLYKKRHQQILNQLESYDPLNELQQDDDIDLWNVFQQKLQAWKNPINQDRRSLIIVEEEDSPWPNSLQVGPTHNDLSFIIREDELVEMTNTGNNKLQIVCEKLVYPEDKRPQRPIVIFDPESLGVWVVIMDFFNKKIVQQYKLDIDDVQSSEQINVCLSSKIYEVLRVSKEVTKQNIENPSTFTSRKDSLFAQNYSIAIHNQKQQRVCIYEFELTWSPLKNSTSNFSVESKLLARKEIITRFQFTKCDVVTSIDSETQKVQGVNVALRSLQNQGVSKRTFTVYDEDESYFNFVNMIASSRYRKHIPDLVYADAYFDKCNQFIQRHFSNFEIFKILYDQVSATLNIIPYEGTFGDKFSIFEPLEILQGVTLAEYIMNEPNTLAMQLKKEVHKKTNVNHLYSGKSLIQMVLNDDKIRTYKFLQNGLLKLDLTSVSTNLQTSLEKCIKKEYKKSGDLLISHILTLDRNADNYALFLRILPMVIDDPAYISYEEFFETCMEFDSQALRFEVTVHDSSLPIFSLEKLRVYKRTLQNGCFWNNQGRQAVREFHKQLTSQQKIEKGKKAHEVVYTFIDFRMLRLGMKRQNLTQSSSFSEIVEMNEPLNDYELSLFLNKILEQGKIKDQAIIQNLIDSQFVYSYKFQTINLLIYLILFYLPLMQSIFRQDQSREDELTFSLIVGLVTQFYFGFIEVIQMKEQGLSYFMDAWNYPDLFLFIIYTAYAFNVIFYDKEEEYNGQMTTYFQTIPLASPFDQDKISYLQQLNHPYILMIYSIGQLIIIFLTTFKLLYLLRVNSRFGILVNMIFQTLEDCKIFIGFFIFWIFILSSQQLVIGVNTNITDSGRYSMLTRNVATWLQTYQNGLGVINVPYYDFWRDQINYVIPGEEVYTMVMIYLIWGVYCLNCIFLCVIMLNFLIALIGQSYQTTIDNQFMLKYSDRILVNIQMQVFFSFFNKIQRFDYILIQKEDTDGKHNDDDYSSHITNIRLKIKNQMAKLTNKIAARQKDVDNNVKTLEAEIDSIQNLVDKLEYRKFDADGNPIQRKPKMLPIQLPPSAEPVQSYAINDDRGYSEQYDQIPYQGQ